MSTLDDTNVYYRKGESGAKQVKEEAKQLLLGGYALKDLEAMNKRFITENISPGGSADMLALTRLVQSFTE